MTGIPTWCLRSTLGLLLLAWAALPCAVQAVVTGPPTVNTPPAYPPPPAPVASTPTPSTSDQEVSVGADWWAVLADEVTLVARGHVTLSSQGYILTAGEAEGNTDTGDFTLRGGVTLMGEGRAVSGPELRLNFRTRKWSAPQASGQTQPPPLLGPIFLRAHDLSGAPTEVSTGEASFTTCDIAVPHYHIQARTLTIVPGRRLVAKHASLFIGRHRLFSLPRLVIPLRRMGQGGSRYSLVPELGQNNIEGFYLKTAYNYTLGGDNLGVARVDLMSKRGVGVGLDQTYRIGAGSGSLVLYSVLASLAGGKELTGTLRHTQKLFGFETSLVSELRRNSYLYAPETRTQTSTLSFTRSAGPSSTSLTLRTDGNSTGSGSFDRASADFSHQRTFGRTSVSLNLGYFSSESPGYSQSELNTRAKVTTRLQEADLGLAYERKDPLKTPPGGLTFSSLDRLPELTIATGGSRFRTGLLKQLPGSLAFSYGDFHEEPTDVHETRAALELRPDTRRVSMGSTTLTVGGGFRQRLYEDGGAQYLLDGNANLTSRLTKANTLQLNYTYLKPNGYTPFRFDDMGSYNTLSGGFIHRDNNLRVSLSTGYDLRGGPFKWQDLTLRLWGKPVGPLLLLGATSYDVNRARFRDVVNELRLRAGEWQLDFATRYMPTGSKFSSIRWSLKTPFINKWRLETLGGYNGVAGRYDYRIFRITRDHHDWQTSLAYVEETGLRFERGIRLMFRLKVFPAFDDLAVGQYGQNLNTDVGEIY